MHKKCNQTKHATRYETCTGQLRKDKIATLKRTSTKQQDLFTKRNAESDSARSQDFALFANPFEAIVKNVPAHLQMKLVDLQCDGHLKSKFGEVPLVKFYGEYTPHDTFPVLVNHARMLTSLFGSTYMCEQLFSKMNFAKSKTRTQLNDAHLDGTLRLASRYTTAAGRSRVSAATSAFDCALKMNFAKCKTCTQLSDAHLDGTLRLASTQLQRYIQHNIGH